MKKYDAPLDPSEQSTLDAPASIPALDLPDAPDFVSRPSRRTLAQMIPLLEEYRQWFPPTDAQREQRRKRKCDVEFIL